MDDAAKVLADPTAYADDARLHAALTHLRANNPVAWVDNPPYRPFWAITKHADIMASNGTTSCSSASPGRCWPPPRPTIWPRNSSKRAWVCAR